MGERQHTFLCIFDQSSPRISTYKIHEWIHDQLQVQEHSVLKIQIGRPKRQIYVKFTDDSYARDIL
jgi:hypothetical protein